MRTDKMAGEGEKTKDKSKKKKVSIVADSPSAGMLFGSKISVRICED